MVAVEANWIEKKQKKHTDWLDFGHFGESAIDRNTHISIDGCELRAYVCCVNK